jgi:hypothetical protein
LSLTPSGVAGCRHLLALTNRRDLTIGTASPRVVIDERALSTVGRDAEALALARAVRWHCQGRVLLNGHSTVVCR